MAAGAERGRAGLLDPHRLERVHVVGVRLLQRTSIFVVDLSDGGTISWRMWCEWGQHELRDPGSWNAGRRALAEERGGGDA